MAHYQFSTVWKFEQPVEVVWQFIYDMDQWPAWWKYVRFVESIKAGDEYKIGSIRRITWSTALPYTITFDSELTHFEEFRRLEGKAHGDLTGTGIWTFTSNKEGTQVRYDWNVSTTRNWMNLLAPVLRPVFAWNHDRVMRAGYKGLLKKMS